MQTEGYQKVQFFKRHQRDGIYHYYKVFGGPGKTRNGYQLVVNFLNEHPIVYIDRNYITDPSGLTGTWCTYEVGIPISEEEFEAKLKEADEDPFTKYMDVLLQWKIDSLVADEIRLNPLIYPIVEDMLLEYGKSLGLERTADMMEFEGVINHAINRYMLTQ